MSAVADADEALVAQWSLLGRPPGAELHEERGITWFETPISHLPYNGVIEARLGDDPATDKAIGEVLQRFRRRGVQNLWFFPTTTTPDDLDRRVEAQGLRCVEQMTYMWLDRDDAPTVAAPDVEIVEVLDNEALDVYTALTVAYWEIPENERRLVADIQRALGPGTIPGHRFLAMADGRPLGKAYLSLAGPAEVASIYGMSVLP
jgi:hypothetical protein